MPLNLPDKLPAIELLKEENIFVIDNSRASAQDIQKRIWYVCFPTLPCSWKYHL